MDIRLEQADKMIRSAIQRANELGVSMAIAVVDGGGHIVAAARMDGATLPALDVAIGKAFTAVAFRRDTRLLAESFGQVPFFANGPQLSGGRLVFMGGGKPLLENGQMIGGIGIAGAPEQQDEECAAAALSQL